MGKITDVGWEQKHHTDLYQTVMILLFNIQVCDYACNLLILFKYILLI